MGWDGIEIKNGQSEAEAIIEFVESHDQDTKCVAHSFDNDTGVYYLALKKGGEVNATIASTKSFKGEVKEGWVHVKFISECATPIYFNPSKEVFETLTCLGDDHNYEWRELVKQHIQYKEKIEPDEPTDSIDNSFWVKPRISTNVLSKRVYFNDRRKGVNEDTK